MGRSVKGLAKKMRTGARMEKFSTGIFAGAMFVSVLVAQAAPTPEKREQLPSQSTAIKDVLVPVPREIFDTLGR